MTFTSAEGENTRRYSQGRLKRDPSEKAISSTRDFWCRLISVGVVCDSFSVMVVRHVAGSQSPTRVAHGLVCLGGDSNDG